MPIYNYRCFSCDHEEKDLYFTIKDLPRARECSECGKVESKQDFRGTRDAQITSTSSMYGVWQPAAGRAFANYEEKKKWLKENNLMETNDPVGGSRNKRREAPPTPRESAQWIDNPEMAHL